MTTERLSLVRDREGPSVSMYVDPGDDMHAASVHIGDLGLQVTLFFSADEARQLAEFFSAAAAQREAA